MRRIKIKILWKQQYIESSVTFIYESLEKLVEVKDKLKSLGYPEDGEANTLGSKAKSYVSCAIGKMS